MEKKIYIVPHVEEMALEPLSIIMTSGMDEGGPQGPGMRRRDPIP